MYWGPISSLLTTRGGAFSTEYSPSCMHSSNMYTNNVTPRWPEVPYLLVSPEDHFLFSSHMQVASGSTKSTVLFLLLHYTPSLLVLWPMLVRAVAVHPPGAAIVISLSWEVFFVWLVWMPMHLSPVTVASAHLLPRISIFQSSWLYLSIDSSLADSFTCRWVWYFNLSYMHILRFLLKL